MVHQKSDLNSQISTPPWYHEVCQGLHKPHKELPCKLFYDERGSRLFERICQLPEYYPTRVEQAIMETAVREITALIGAGCLLIEYGSGSSQKTRILLNHLPLMAGYVPIDIAHEHLQQTVNTLTTAYPDLEILPVCADYESDFKLPTPHKRVSRRVIYYPGSTIGNFHPEDAVTFLQRMRHSCGVHSDLLIGVDLKKDPDILHNAYNDSAGITADFNLNILVRLNRELGANFVLDQFRHHACYNTTAGRIEMYLVSLCAQIVHINGQIISFDVGEQIWTESSYKYSMSEFAALAKHAGLRTVKVWTDPEQLFSVHYLTPRMNS